MSAICGWVGAGSPAWMGAMLDAIPYRGDATDVVTGPGVALGYRWWRGRPKKAPGIFRAADGAWTAVSGTLAPAVDDPAACLDPAMRDALGALDGAFSAARWDGTLTLLRDPFGVRPLYYAHFGEAFVFASELKQLLALPGFPRVVDLRAVHKYLTFSFVPGEDAILQGVRRLLPGHRLTWRAGVVQTEPWFRLTEDVDPALEDQGAAVRAVRVAAKAAVARRLADEPEVGLALSGGLDSAGVGWWLRKAGATVHAFSLDFGDASVDREAATLAAEALHLRHTWVPADGARVGAILDTLVDRLDLPFGDAVTGPLHLLTQAARDAGLSALFNGEGGDQLFGGWTTKPMVAAAVYGDVDETSPEEEYLHAYHRFYGLESALYSAEFAAQVGGPGQRRALLAPYLGDGAARSFLHRVRLADLALKGSQNILPRAERIGNGVGIDIRVPLFDRELAALAFRIPPGLKLKGASEKHVLKLALQDRLPDSLVWRRKSGMSVPITDWILGPVGGGPAPLGAIVRDTLSPDAVRRRGWFQPAYVEALIAGRDAVGEVRRRRVGEKIWTLFMLERWARHFVGAP